jgi:hypothetical protein
MKMRWIILTDIIDVPKVCSVIEMIQFRRVFETACEIPDCTSGVIERNKKAVSMPNNISSERHLSKRLFFFLVAKITFRARFEKNVVYIAETTGEIRNFVRFLYFHDPAPRPCHEISDTPTFWSMERLAFDKPRNFLITNERARFVM